MVKIVIGLTGTMASGKETVMEALTHKFNSYTVTLSSIIRGELEKKKKIFDRKMLQDMGNELRQKYGGGILARLAIDYLPRDKELIIVDGIRNLGEVEYLKKVFGNKFVLIAVDAPQEIRWQRIQSRARPTDSKTWEEFVALDQRDRGVREPLYGEQIDRCMERADYKIENDGNLENLQEKINEIMAKLSAAL